MGEPGRDILQAFRRLRRAPLFTAFSVLTLGLGIGITTAAYSVLYGILWRDPAIPDPRGLLTLGQVVDWSDFQELGRQQTALHVAASAEFSAALAGGQTVEIVRGVAVSGRYFQVVGVTASMGRMIQSTDDAPGAGGVVVLSEAVWRAQFGADPEIVGRAVRVAGRVVEVVGVAPDAFRGVQVVAMRPVGVWIPLETARQAAATLGRPFLGGFDPASRDTRWLTVVLRLRPGRTLAEAGSDLAALSGRLDAVLPLHLPAEISPVNTRNPVRAWVVRPALDRSRLANAVETARVMLAVPALVLLVACTNLSNLVLSRGLLRRHEQSVRQALGASRWRLIRPPLLESAAVALAGGAGGTIVAWWILQWASVTFERAFGFLTPFRIDARVEPAVFGAVGVAMLIALVVAGLAPAWRLTRGDLRRFLTTDVATSQHLRWRGRSNLIALQVAVSVALFLVTALAVRILPAMHQAPGPGRALDRAAVVEVPFRQQQADEARVRETIHAVVTEAGRLPGVEAVAATGPLGGTLVRITTPDRPFLPQAERTVAKLVCGTPAVFRALDLPIETGRAFDERDAANAGAVVVLNGALAKALFGGRTEAIERDVLVRSYAGRSRADEDGTETLHVVGVTADTTLNRQGRPDLILYRPLAQHADPDVTFVARSATVDPASIVQLLRTAVRRADPDLAVRYAGTADVLFQAEATAVGMAAGAVGVLAAIALVLAMAGLYGVLSHVVVHRTREIGVRIALGADAGHITRLVIGDAVRPVAEGLFIGLGAAAVIRLMLQPSFTQTIAAFDPVAIVAAVVPLVVAAGVASYLPARRASRVDPNIALKEP